MKDYKQPKMVKWYQPKMLLNIGAKAVISGVFGNYADRRELEAALGSMLQEDKQWESIKAEYTDRREIWIDFAGDTGDGFNSTFAIARTLAQRELVLQQEGGGEEIVTQRGKILVFGGDEVYPFPTKELYETNFKIPYDSASDDVTELKRKEGRPHLYAIPGNHDWYDGLGNFMKLFCQQRDIGIWTTRQHRSYFALPLPNHYWIWATDIQLNSDIDAPQLEYFADLARTKMNDGDKVILVTAEPAWVYNEIRHEDKSFERLEFFISKYIHNRDGSIGRRFKLAATLTGDLHHYSRYCDAKNPSGHQYMTAGGGGAFLHLTHDLPDCLEAVRKEEVRKQRSFPSPEDSKTLLLGNLLFPFKNQRFVGLLWCMYLLFFWVLTGKTGPFAGMAGGAIGTAVGVLANGAGQFYPWMLFDGPGIACMTVGLGLGFCAFADVNVRCFRMARVVGILHGLAQVALLAVCLYWIGRAGERAMEVGGWWNRWFVVVAGCFVGSVAAGVLLGVYLYCSNRLFGMHLDEASSSLACPDYKNFLRLRVHEGGVTIYPVGIRRVPRKWKQQYHEKDDRWSFSGGKVEAFLIEAPIEIQDEKLNYGTDAPFLEE